MTVDINDIRSLVTVLGFLLFLALVARTWRRAARSAHERASHLVFEGETSAAQPAPSSPKKEHHHG